MSDSQWTVTDDDVGVRVDKFLAAPQRLGSRGRAAAALERGKVLINGTEATLRDAARRLALGDVVRLWMDRPGTARRRPDGVEVDDLAILHEDDRLIVLNKRAGMLAVPLEVRDTPSIFDRIAAYLRSRGKRRPFVVHRIDRDTSGLVLFAKDPDTQAQVKGQFRRREPERVYRAIVYGHPEPPTGTWRDTLVWDDKDLIQRETHARDPRGKEAISEYRVLERFGGAPASGAGAGGGERTGTSLLEVRLRTGRRNQIRIQARLRGHTLVGEQRYVFGPDALRPIAFPRQALHAYRLTFRHPADDREMRFEAPLPADLLELLARLRRA